MFGSGIENLEQNVQREVDELCHGLSESHGVPIDPKKLISVGIMNIICACLFETRYSPGDEYLEEMFELVNETVYMIGSANLLEIFPFMKFLPLDIHKRIKYYIELSEKLFFRQNFKRGSKHTKMGLSGTLQMPLLRRLTTPRMKIL